MVCLVTGGNGLVGSYVMRQLLSKGFTVKALRRPQSNLSQIEDIKDQVHWIDGDILDVLSLENAIEANDLVVHAAGLVSFNKKDNAQLLKINVEGTANVVNVCLSKGVGKLCHVSSVAAIGHPDESQQLVTEQNKWNSDEVSSPYAFSKHLAEQEVWRGIEEGLPAVIVNPSVILGAGDWKRSSLQLLDRIHSSPFYFYPPGIINYIDVRDVAHLISELLIAPSATGKRFILNAGATSYFTFFKEIATRFGHPPPKKLLKYWLANLASRLASVQALFTGSVPKLTKSTIQSSFSRVEYDNQQIVNAFQHTFIPLQHSLDEVCNAYLNKQHMVSLEGLINS